MNGEKHRQYLHRGVAREATGNSGPQSTTAKILREQIRKMYINAIFAQILSIFFGPFWSFLPEIFPRE